MIEILYDDGEYRIERSRLPSNEDINCFSVYRHIDVPLVRVSRLQRVYPNDLAWERIFRRLHRYLDSTRRVPNVFRTDPEWYHASIKLIGRNWRKFRVMMAEAGYEEISA